MIGVMKDCNTKRPSTRINSSAMVNGEHGLERSLKILRRKL